jgi:hypothetical protein
MKGPDMAHPHQHPPLAAGMAGGLLGAFAMNTFARLVRFDRGREARGAAAGPDRDGRGPQPAQAKQRAEDDAAARVGAVAYEMLTGRHPAGRQKRRLGTAAHYGFGAACGLVYAALVNRLPRVAAGGGLLYGAIVWAVADEGVVPALGLSRGPRELPRPLLAYGFASHVIFGATLNGIVETFASRAVPFTFYKEQRVDLRSRS